LTNGAKFILFMRQNFSFLLIIVSLIIPVYSSHHIAGEAGPMAPVFIPPDLEGGSPASPKNDDGSLFQAITKLL